jgi:hypothetical protein
MKRLFLHTLVFAHLISSKGNGQNSLQAKYREWIEDDDRVEVRSWYAETEVELEQDWSFEFLGTIDAWSGATPDGMPPISGSTTNSWLLAVPEEIRKAGLLTLQKGTQHHDFSLEYGISDEPDYLSRSYAVQYSYKLAADTLIFNTGLYLQDDSVKDFTGNFVNKKTPSLSVGLTRILNKFTTVSFNMSYSSPYGYLSDPYKGVPVPDSQRYSIPSIDTISLVPENRPDEREIFVIYSEISRYLERLKIGTHLSYRYFKDNHELTGHTFEVELLRRFADKLIFSPHYRFYRQNQVSFYSPKVIDYQPYMQAPNPTTGPFYSADYRLSSFDSHSLGLKISYFLKDDLLVDVGYDRYLTAGKDDITDNRVYPDANVFTIGFQWEY